MPPETSDAADKCPVDHQTREKWLEAARAKGQSMPPHPPTSAATPAPTTAPPRSPPSRPAVPSHFSLDTGRWESYPTLTAAQLRLAGQRGGSSSVARRLPHDREISTIPRSLRDDHTRGLNSAERAALPPSTTTTTTTTASHSSSSSSFAANHETDTGHDAATGNWVYPSQAMFFAAMQRKGHEAAAADMASIVPIHNAVNERAWAEIKAWEAGRGAERCGGPALVSFAGDSKALTPRARWNALLGYAPPFDRHDWVVDRCGTQIDYVIDFYAGKGGDGNGGGAGLGKSLSFYLDVRPKLNSWEGVKMRVLRSVGM